MVIGPVNGVLQVLCELFDEVRAAGQDLVLTPSVGSSCNFLESSDEEFKAFLVNAIRQSIWNTLSREMCPNEPRRKDMRGFDQHVILTASMVGTKPPKTKTNQIPARLWKQLHLTVVTGAPEGETAASLHPHPWRHC